MRAILALVVLAGCTQQPPSDLPAANSYVASFDWPGAIPPKLDVLVVLDATTESAPYRARIDALMRTLAATVEDPTKTPLEQHDLHVAVTTAGGVLHGAAQVHGDYLSDVHAPDGSRVRDYDGELGDALVALADVGTAGTASSPIEAALAALDVSDWLRPTAPLAVMIVSPRDDGGTIAVADAAAMLKAAKDDPTNVLVTAAYPLSAPRLDAFVAQFPNRASTIEIDANDYGTLASILLDVVKSILAVPCIAEPLDLDPQTAGAQYDCAISIVREDDVEVLQHDWAFHPEPVACGIAGFGNIEVPPYHWPVHPHLRGQCVTAVISP